MENPTQPAGRRHECRTSPLQHDRAADPPWDAGSAVLSLPSVVGARISCRRPPRAGLRRHGSRCPAASACWSRASRPACCRSFSCSGTSRRCWRSAPARASWPRCWRTAPQQVLHAGDAARAGAPGARRTCGAPASPTPGGRERRRRRGACRPEAPFDVILLSGSVAEVPAGAARPAQARRPPDRHRRQRAGMTATRAPRRRRRPSPPPPCSRNPGPASRSLRRLPFPTSGRAPPDATQVAVRRARILRTVVRRPSRTRAGRRTASDAGRHAGGITARSGRDRAVQPELPAEGRPCIRPVPSRRSRARRRPFRCSRVNACQHRRRHRRLVRRRGPGATDAPGRPRSTPAESTGRPFGRAERAAFAGPGVPRPASRPRPPAPRLPDPPERTPSPAIGFNANGQATRSPRWTPATPERSAVERRGAQPPLSRCSAAATTPPSRRRRLGIGAGRPGHRRAGPHRARRAGLLRRAGGAGHAGHCAPAGGHHRAAGLGQAQLRGRHRHHHRHARGAGALRRRRWRRNWRPTTTCAPSASRSTSWSAAAARRPRSLAVRWCCRRRCRRRGAWVSTSRPTASHRSAPASASTWRAWRPKRRAPPSSRRWTPWARWAPATAARSGVGGVARHRKTPGGRAAELPLAHRRCHPEPHPRKR